MAPASGDPVATRNFSIEIDKCHIAQFRDVQGLSNTISVIEIRENNGNGLQMISKVPGQSTSGDITLKRGKTANTALWDWFQMVLAGDIDKARSNGHVVLYDYQNRPVARYEFKNGWPSKLDISNLSATGTDTVVEECVISHEGLVLAPLQ